MHCLMHNSEFATVNAWDLYDVADGRMDLTRVGVLIPHFSVLVTSWTAGDTERTFKTL